MRLLAEPPGLSHDCSTECLMAGKIICHMGRKVRTCLVWCHNLTMRHGSPFCKSYVGQWSESKQCNFRPCKEHVPKKKMHRATDLEDLAACMQSGNINLGPIDSIKVTAYPITIMINKHQVKDVWSNSVDCMFSQDQLSPGHWAPGN